MAASAWNAAPASVLDVVSDERLARLASRGDERAFGVLYARHRPGVTRYCRGILRNDADADDAAQNALVAAHRALEDGTVPMRVKPWLYRIAHNEAISLARRRRSDATTELDEAALPTVGGAEEITAVRERLGQLMTDLQELSERQRQALVLRELYDFSYAEIAATQSCTEAAAQQTVFEARSSLQHFDEGRALACESVQRAMSACDGMRLRTRGFRAHIRDCSPCREFESALRVRRRDLGLLFPPVGGAGGVLAVLARLLGGGGGESLLGSLGLKPAVVGLALLAGGGAVVGVTSSGGDGAPAGRPPTTAAPALGAASTGSTDSGTTNPQAPSTTDGPKSARPESGQAGKRPGQESGQAGKRPGRKRRPGASGAGEAPGAVSAGDATGSGGGVGHSGGGSGGGGPGAGSGATPAVPKTRAPSTGDATVDKVTGAVSDVVNQVTDTVNGAAQGAAGAVGDAAQSAGEAAGGVVQGAGDAAGGAVQSAAGTAGGTTGAVGDAVGDATSKLPHLP